MKKTMIDWKRYLRNACNRIVQLIIIKLGGKGKWVKIEKTYVFRFPKHYIAEHRKYFYWMFADVRRETSIV